MAGSRNRKVVPREKLEMWCSDQCAERALYLRVQLAEEPVLWERRAVDSLTKPPELLEEAPCRREIRNRREEPGTRRCRIGRRENEEAYGTAMVLVTGRRLKM